MTCYGERPHIITCEGDVRIHIDGIKTPQVESDGSESYICYGGDSRLRPRAIRRAVMTD